MALKIGQKVFLQGCPDIVWDISDIKFERLILHSQYGYYGEVSPSEVVKFDLLHRLVYWCKDRLQRLDMRKYTPKRQRQVNLYAKRRLIFLENNPYCKYCGKPATDIHHSRGRVGDMLLDERYWEPICRKCHETKRPEYYGNAEQS